MDTSITIQALGLEKTDIVYVDSMIQYTILILSYALLLRMAIAKKNVLRYYMNSTNWLLIFVILYSGTNIILLLLGLSSIIQYTPISWLQVITEEIEIIPLWIVIRVLEYNYRKIEGLPTAPYKSDVIIKKSLPLFK